MGFKTTTLLVLAALSAANAFYKLVPDNKELVYDYKALVKAGTYFPEEHASEFYLHGKLHVQTVGHVAYMKFSDMHYKMYNGEVDHDHDAHHVPVGTEVEDLYKVFSVTYDETGKATGFSVYPSEKPYTINMKKAIAVIFQMKWDEVISVPKKHAFTSHEMNLYTTDSILYNVLPHTDGTVTVEKYHEMHSTKHLYEYKTKNYEWSKCDTEPEEPMSHDSQKEYTITKHDGHYVAKHIVSSGGVYFHPYKAQAETQSVYTNMTFDLIDVTPITTKLMMTETKPMKNLKYTPYEYSPEVMTIPDIYQGRRVHNMKVIEEQLNVMFKEVMQYLEEDHLTMKQPEVKHGQLINRITRLMAHLDMPTLEHLWKFWSEKTDEQGKKVFEFFQQVLPMVGTDVTVQHIMHLVTHNMVKENHAIHMLEEMPMNVKVPTIKLLTTMEPLLHMDTTKVTKHVKNTAILSFATMVHKTYEFTEKYYEFKEDMTTWKKYEHFADKYVTEFVTKIKTAEDYETKMLYLEALFNTEVPSIIPYVSKMIKGEWEMDNELRFVAMWSVFPMIKEMPEMVYTLYWPIMTDTTETTHHRILAFYLIMESHPTLSRMINIYWHMQHETNHEVYQFYYKYLSALAHSHDDCRSITKLHATQVLKYTHKPNFYGLTGYYRMDFTDEDFGFGKAFDTMFILDKKTAFLKFSMKYNFANTRLHPITWYIKVHGIEGMEKIGLNTKETTTLFNYEELSKFFRNMDKVEKLHIEFIMFKNDKVVRSWFINKDNFDVIPTVLFNMFSEDFSINKKSIDVTSKMYRKVIMPTEIGFPVVMDWMVPALTYNKLAITRETVNSVVTYHVDTQMKTWVHGRYGLSFYNTISDVWQGVNRYTTFDSSYPLYFDVVVNTSPGSVKMSFKKHNDMIKDTWGYRSHITTMTFVKDDYHTGVLTKSTPTAKNWNVVTKGEEYRRNWESMHETNYFTGYDHMVTMYDSERHFTNATLKDLGHFFDMDDYFDDETITEMLMNYLKKWDHTILQPYQGTNGVLEKFVPSKEHPVTHFDITLRAHYDLTKTERLLLPGIKFNTRLAFTTARDEKTLKTWDVHTIFDINPGHTLANMKMQFHRIIPGKTPYKMCIDGTKKWTQDMVTGHLVVGEATGPIENKCTSDHTIMEVTMKGEKSPEQTTKYHDYVECDDDVNAVGTHHKLLPCYVAHDTFRKYTYDVKTNLDSQQKVFGFKIWEFFKGSYFDQMTFVEVPTEEVKTDHTKVMVTYPMFGNVFNMYVITPNHEYHFEELKDSFGQWMTFHPDTAHFSNMYKFMHRMGWTDTCSVYNDTIHFKYHAVPYHVPSEWTMMAGETAENPMYAVYVKEVEGTHHMALKLKHKDSTLTFVPTTEHHYDILLDGQKVNTVMGQYRGDWFFFNHLPHTDFINIITKHIGVHLYYDGTHVHIEIPKMDRTFHGVCYKH